MVSGTGKASERFTVKRFNLAPRSDPNRFELQLKSSLPCSHQPHPSAHQSTPSLALDDTFLFWYVVSTTAHPPSKGNLPVS